MFEIGSILLVLALASLVGIFVSRPLLEKRTASQPLITRREAGEREQRLSALLAERDRVLTALQELEFDYSLGKVTAERYAPQRAALVSAGAQTLRELDELQGSQPRAEEKPEEDELEALIARHRQQRKAEAARTCAQCGAEIRPSDRFCSKCGSGV